MKKQTGSAYVVIIIILVVAVLGLLSFAFWQQVNGKSKTATTPAPETASSLKTYKDSKNSYTFNYPNDWTIGASTCLASCNNSQTFTVRAPDFTTDGQGNNNGALVVVSPNAVSGSLQDQRKKDEAFTQTNGYTYYYNFTDTTVAGEQGYEYHVADQDNSKANDGVNVVFLDKSGAIWIIGGTGTSVTSSSQYDGAKTVELIRSSWKWL